jgi:hypothetical protein
LSSMVTIFMFADPTMTQTFFEHFNCRRIDAEMWVLHKDYAYACWGGHAQWWMLATVAVLGLVAISFGIPIFLCVVMRKRWTEEMQMVRHEGKPRAVAYTDFHQQYSYISVRY